MVTTINAYSVSLGLDAKSFIDTSKLSRAETASLVREINAAKTPMEKYATDVNRLDKALKEGAISQQVYNRLLEDKKRKLLEATGALKTHTEEVVKSSNQSGVLASQLKTLIAGYVGMQTITKSVRLAIDAEQAAASFEILAGSTEDAKRMLADIRDFAAKSPVSLQGAQDAARTMMAFNVPIQDVSRNLRMLGDISGGNQMRFDMLALSFSQMSAAGRLMGQDLLQMVNAGFNPLQEISRKTGETMMQLKQRMEDGAISAQEVTDAFVSATSEGGRFAGLSDRLAETMGGRLSIAMAQLDEGLAKVGKSLGPLIIELTQGFEEGKSAIDDIVYAVDTLGNGLAFVVAVSRDALAAIRDMNENAVQLLNNPFTNPNELVDINANPFANATRFMDAYEQRKRDAINDANLGAMESGANAIADGFGVMMDNHVKLYEEHIKKQTEFYTKLSENAIKNAERHFEQERKRTMQMRLDASAGPGAGMELGSAEAAKFMAEQVNAAIGAAAVPVLPTPGEQELIKEAQKQAELLMAQQKKQAEVAETLAKILEVEKQNGFKRIR